MIWNRPATRLRKSRIYSSAICAMRFPMQQNKTIFGIGNRAACQFPECRLTFRKPTSGQAEFAAKSCSLSRSLSRC
jgi:hypothetical protein